MEELDNLKGSEFYNSWKKRFDKLSHLGNDAVLALPNTTFDEWIYYFKRWSEVFSDDYEEFKDLTDEVVKKMGEEYDRLDPLLESFKSRFELMESKIAEDGLVTKDEMEEYKQKVSGDLGRFESTQTKNFSDFVTGQGNTMTAFQNSVNQKQANGLAAMEATQNRGLTEMRDIVNNKVAQLNNGVKAYPNAQAIKDAYPNGADGIFIATNTGHQWYYVNGQWTDAGAYQATGNVEVQNARQAGDYLAGYEFPDLSTAIKSQFHYTVNGLQFEKGYIKTDGTLSTTANGSHEWWLRTTSYIPVHRIKSIDWYLFQGAAGVAFYNRDKQFIKGFVGTSQGLEEFTNTNLELMKFAHYVKLSVDKSKFEASLIELNPTTPDDGEILRDKVSYELGYIKPNGSLSTSADTQHTYWIKSEYIPVKDIKSIDWYLFDAAASVALYDSDKNFINAYIGTGGGLEHLTDLSKLGIASYIRVCINYLFADGETFKKAQLL